MLTTDQMNKRLSFSFIASYQPLVQVLFCSSNSEMIHSHCSRLYSTCLCYHFVWSVNLVCWGHWPPIQNLFAPPSCPTWQDRLMLVIILRNVKEKEVDTLQFQKSYLVFIRIFISHIKFNSRKLTAHIFLFIPSFLPCVFFLRNPYLTTA